MFDSIKGYIGAAVAILAPFMDDFMIAGQLLALVGGLVLVYYNIRVKQLEKKRLEDKK